MRIVLVNWARIWDGASRGGGVNGYCQGIALELARRGHEVISLCGGSAYEPEIGLRRIGPCRIDRHPDWLGIRVFEVINSPVLAPAMAQFRDAAGEISAPKLERQIEGLIRKLEPDIVHFHNIEGFSAGCVEAVRRAAPQARILFSLHNYHTICPQVYLMQGHRRPCHTYDNGRACTNCIPTVDPAQEKYRIACGGPAAEFTWNQTDTGIEEPAATGGILRRLKRATGALRSGRIALAPTPDPRTVPLEVLQPMPHHGEDARGQTRQILLSRRPHPWSAEGMQIPAWRPLLNTPGGEPPSDKPPNIYAKRRAAMVAMLNACDQVLAVSSFVHQKFAALGVNPGRLRTLHIGSRMPEIVARRPEALVPPPPFGMDSQRPIRIAFVGYNNWYKGLPMLVDSLELLTPEVLGCFHLCIYALNGEEMEPALRRLEPRLAGLTLRHGYEPEELPWLLSDIDLGLVTSVWWDNGPQTVMEFLACGIPILAAELGGIPDFIRDGENGLLFRGNDRWDLARRLADIARRPTTLNDLRTRVHPPKSMREHTSELEELYTTSLP